MTSALRRPREWAPALVAALALGLGLRLLTLAVPSALHPDEVFQYLEAAHRYLFGYGVVPWEYRVGMRSWLFPLLLAAPMALGNALAPGSGLYLLLPRLAMVLASTTIIGSAWTIGSRISTRHAAMAALVAATWYELVAFASHPLGEAAGLASAMAGGALLFGPRTSPSRALAAGAMFALTAILRFQFAPALLVLALFAAKTRWRTVWLPMVLGGAIVAAISSVVDISFGMVPFGWVIENVRQNILLGKAEQFGVAPPLAYVGELGNRWRWASVPILIAIYAGAKRQPALFWAAFTHFVLHSLINHKEYRFILLSQGLYIVLAGIGTVDIADALAKRLRGDRRALLYACAALGWVVTSASLAGLMWNRPLWTQRSTAIAAFDALRRDQSLCGIALIGLPVSEMGGYVSLHRNVPIYLPDTTYPRQHATAAALAPAANVMVVTGLRQTDVPAGYARIGCQSTAGEYIGNYTNPQDAGSMASICVYRRPARCDAAAQRASKALEVNPALARMGM